MHLLQTLNKLSTRQTTAPAVTLLQSHPPAETLKGPLVWGGAAMRGLTQCLGCQLCQGPGGTLVPGRFHSPAHVTVVTLQGSEELPGIKE